MSVKPTYEELEQRVKELENASLEGKLAEDNLKKNRAFLNATGRIAKVGGWELDLNSLEVRWTEETAHIHEVPLNYVPPLDEAIKFYPPEERPGLQEAIKRAIEYGESYDREMRFITATGKHLWVHAICNPEVVGGKTIKLTGTFQDITENKRAEKALKDNEAFLETLIDSIPIPVFYKDRNGKYLGFNRSFETFFGETKERLIGKSVFDINPPELAGIYHAQDEKLLNEESVQSYQSQVKNAHGELRDVIFNKAVFTNSKGTVTGLIGAILDITERKQAEEALKERELLFSQLFEQSTTSMCLYNPDGAVNRVNNEFCKMFGVEEKSIINAGYNVFKDQAAIDAGLIPLLRDIFEEKKRKHWEANFNIDVASTSTGTPTSRTGKIFLEVFGYPVLNRNGNLQYVVLQHYDITDRKRAEEALKTAETTYRNIFRNAQIGLFRTDMNTGLILDANNAVAQFIGYKDRNELLAEPFNIAERYVDPKDREKIVSLLKANGEFRNYEARYRSNDGAIIWMRFSARIVPEKGWMEGVSEDITEQKLAEASRLEAEREKEMLQAQLQQSQKMESIGTLAGGIAHDFNNILGIILGNAELAMDDVPEWNPARQNLDEVRKACMRAKDVVRQILSFSRKSETEQKPLNLAPVVVESLKLLRASIPTNIEIRQNIANDVDNIFGDPTQIHQVMINLCTNAAHAMEKDGGILEVALENTEIDEDTASQYPELNPGPHVHLGVSDTGDGINPEVVDRVFDPYFTTKEVGKGTGMGLAVVHGIVKSHRGTISVESEPGKGTTFKLLFPTVKEKVGDEPKKAQGLPTGKESILFVDDEESMVNLNQQRLERLGYKVIPKTDPLEALEFFRTNPDQIDLIISDMTMPHMTGDKLAQEILNIRPDMPIILCTGYSERMSEDRAQEIGVRKYIEKPIGKETLAMSVREVLDG